MGSSAAVVVMSSASVVGDGSGRLGGQPADEMQDALESCGPGGDTVSVTRHDAPPLRRVVGREVGPNGLERHFEVAQPGNHEEVVWVTRLLHWCIVSCRPAGESRTAA
ncbi:MAG: hypothetical protein WEC14_06445 [Chloroflexota bacterium]